MDALSDDAQMLIVDSTFLRSIFDPPQNARQSAGAKVEPSVSTAARYDKGASSDGMERSRAYFANHIVNGQNRLDETAFVALMERFTNLQSHELLDFFDLLDVNGSGDLDFDTFHLVLSMYFAYDCMQRTKFL